jgi:beta-hydroxylase
MVINYPFAVVTAVYAGSFGYLYHRCQDHLPFHKYLSNHALWLAPLNFLFTFFTVGPQTPVFDTKCAPGLDKLKENYPLIRSEAKALLDVGVFHRSPALDEPGFSSFEKGGYRIYRLKWYSEQCVPAAVKLCPNTCALLETIPAIRSALFTVLPPGVRIGRHHDPVASSLRYHLGLLTPNSPKCFMMLDGVEHPWFDGEELLFDQSYLHSAVNQTDNIRVILFCDVEKTQLIPPIRQLAAAVDNTLVARAAGANDQGKVSLFSKIYKPIYAVRSYVKEKVRSRSMLAYNIIKYGALASLLLLLYAIL